MRSRPPKGEEDVEAMLDYYLDFKKQRYLESDAPSVNYLVLDAALKAIRRYFRGYRVCEVSRQSIRDFTKLRRADGAKDGTIRKELTIFRAALNLCRKEEIIDCGLVAFELPSEPPPREHCLTIDQVKQFMAADAYPHIDLFCLLALHTLSRKGAILGLEWSWGVNFDSGLINFNPPGRIQTRKRRVSVPMNSILRKALLEARDFAVSDYVVELNGKSVKSITRGFSSKAKAAGMEWITPHVLRHTGASILAQQGTTMHEIAQIMGDGVRTVEKHYLKFSPDYLKTATTALERSYA